MGIGEIRHLKVVSTQVYRIFQTIPERGVPRLVLILMLIQEETLRADLAIVAANIVHPPIVSCKWSLGTSILSYPKLMWCQSLPHISSPVSIIVFHKTFKGLRALELPWFHVLFVTLDLDF